MTATLIGYARCSTDNQDLTAQRQALAELGVAPDRIYMDKGLTGTNRARPGLDQAMAAVRKGDTLVVPKLDRLARPVPDARHIADQLQAKGAKLALGRNIHDPSDPMGKMFFNILATFAEFEADLIRMRTREGMAIARAKGKLRGKQPKLSGKQQKELCRMHATGDYSIGDLVVCHVSIFGYGHLNLVDASCAANCQTPTPRARKLRCDATLAEVFAISRPTVYRTLSPAAAFS